MSSETTQVRHGVGIIVPHDFALDHEYWQCAPPEVTLHITRTSFVPGTVGMEMARAVADEAEITRAVQALLAAHPEGVAYACTSGSFVGGVHGERHIKDVIVDAGSPRAVTTSGAFIETLQLLGLTRIALATPYDEELTDRFVGFLTEAGVSPVSVSYLGLDQDIQMTRGQTVWDLAIKADSADAQALLISCTNLPTLGLVNDLENHLGKPVLTANEVTMSALLRSIELPLKLRTPFHSSDRFD